MRAAPQAIQPVPVANAHTHTNTETCTNPKDRSHAKILADARTAPEYASIKTVVEDLVVNASL